MGCFVSTNATNINKSPPDHGDDATRFYEEKVKQFVLPETAQILYEHNTRDDVLVVKERTSNDEEVTLILKTCPPKKNIPRKPAKKFSCKISEKKDRRIVTTDAPKKGPLPSNRIKTTQCNKNIPQKPPMTFAGKIYDNKDGPTRPVAPQKKGLLPSRRIKKITKNTVQRDYPARNCLKVREGNHAAPQQKAGEDVRVINLADNERESLENPILECFIFL
ncbi:hypothetical protein Tco_1513000 [Tanacetum coccineum]